MPVTPETAAARDAFQPKRALNTIQRLWETARHMDSLAVRASAEFVAGELRAAGLDNVRIEELPADGRTAPGGWIMPLAWSVTDARLEIGGRGGKVLADYAANPQTLAMYSPETPHGHWVEGPVAVAADMAAVHRPRLRGSFLLVNDGRTSPDLNALAAKAGALGVIVSVPNADPNAARYLNYAVPFDAGRPCVPCFSLTPAQGARLQALLRTTPGLRLRARVRAQRTAATAPLVTATLGQGTPSIYLCAHFDEIGAQDNASGVGVAIEALRVLALVAKQRGGAPPVRAIRVLMGSEVRGLQAWLNPMGRIPPFLAGLNLDMVGIEPHAGASRFILGRGLAGQAHFAHHLLDDAARLANSRVGRMDTVIRRCPVSDAMIGLCPQPGHCSIEQTPDTVYHTSADVPAVLSLRALQWSGTAAVAFLVAATRFSNREVIGLARKITTQTRREMSRRPAEAATLAARAKAELDSLRRALTTPELFDPWPSSAEIYRAGVRRADGLWPAVADRLRFDALAATLPALPKPPPARPTPRSEAKARRAAAALAPEVTFRGFLSFEDQTSFGQKAALARAVGLAPGWSTETWAWALAARLRGKATLADVVDLLRRDGVPADMGKAVALTEYLVRIGKARLRPILGPAALRTALRAAGVRRGSILCLHASLSQFGYIPGGPATLVDAILDVLGPKGTLCMPAHSLSVLGNTPYDPSQSPSMVGAVSEYFRRRPGVRRSGHPTHSVTALGPAAQALTELPREDLAPLAREGFWGKLYDANGDVLLLCPLRSATIFHVGEAWTGVPQPSFVVHTRNGRGRRVFTIPQAPWHVDHFETTMAAPLLRSGAMRRVTLGDANFYLAPARAMADISVAVNRANPLVSIASNGTCGCFYCRTVRLGVERRGHQDA